MKLAALLFASTLALSADVFTGVITDSMCGTNHAAMGVTPTEKCVRECMKHGKHVKYVLHDGKNMYKLSDQQTPEKFAAQKVKITGRLNAKTNIIAVEKIEVAR
jgi:hypothetical protein